MAKVIFEAGRPPLFPGSVHERRARQAGVMTRVMTGVVKRPELPSSESSEEEVKDQDPSSSEPPPEKKDEATDTEERQRKLGHEALADTVERG